MIARTAHARTFSHLALYLESDKAEPGASRAAWWSAYNLPSSSITSAARWMERTAERNRLVHRPAYHLFVAVAPGEDAGHRRMRGVAERLLRRLELAEHQAVAVGHEDRRHPHLHLAVNRVHPVTLRAWDATRDWPRIERALREIERDMGFRVTPGRLAPTPDGQWCDNARAMPVGARRFELREMEKAERARAAGGAYTPRPSFLRFAREHLAPDLVEAGGWADLEAAAARRGLALLQTGRGLVVTDGVHGAAISRVVSGASLHRLTREFGEDYVGYVAQTRGPGRDAPAAGRGGAGEPAGSSRAPGGGSAAGPGATAPAEPARAPGPALAPEAGGLRGGGDPEHPARAGGGDGDVGRERGHHHPADRGRAGTPVRDHGGDAGSGAADRADGGTARRAAEHADRAGAGDCGGAAGGDRLGRGEGEGVVRGEHPGSGEQHRAGAARAGAVGGGAEAQDLPPRDPAGGRDGDPRPARGAPPLPVLGDDARGRGGVEPGDGARADVLRGLAGGAAGDPARAEVGVDAGRAAAFRVERAPGGWAVVHAPAARRWTLAREETARRFAEAGNAATAPARLARVLRALDRETARESHRDLVARSAAAELLDQAAVHCFVDPVAATDVVRWNHLRRQPDRVRLALQAGPAPFGEMRIEREAPDLWARLPEPRHAHVPAWTRFGTAAEVWLDVQEGRPWTPPSEFPPPPAAPVLPRRSAQPTTAPWPRPRPERPLPRLPDEPPIPFARERSPGLSR